MFTPNNYSIEETIDGDWMILRNGIQAGHGPWDLSDCSSQTFPTYREALLTVERWLADD